MGLLDLLDDVMDRSPEVHAHDIVGHIILDLLFIHQYSFTVRHFKDIGEKIKRKGRISHPVILSYYGIFHRPCLFQDYSGTPFLKPAFALSSVTSAGSATILLVDPETRSR